MNELRVKRKYTRKAKPEAIPVTQTPTPVSPLRVPLDALSAAQETARNAQEGNLKLARALELLRAGLETIVYAEMDMATRLPTTATDLRQLAVATLDAYSLQVGQDWRRNRLQGSYAGDRNLEGIDAYASS